jgi:ketosteroid isomerase-like protein
MDRTASPRGAAATWIGAAGLCLALALPAARAAAPDAAEQIRQLEAQINAAYAANDLPRYFSYYAADFRGMFPEGPTSLAEYKRSWTDFIKAGNAIVSFTYTDVQVQVAPSGDAAVASYLATARTRYVGKEPVDEKYFETDVFFRRDGKWQLVEVQYSPQPEAKK